MILHCILVMRQQHILTITIIIIIYSVQMFFPRFTHDVRRLYVQHAPMGMPRLWRNTPSIPKNIVERKADSTHISLLHGLHKSILRVQTSE
jgi:hypothetical protein